MRWSAVEIINFSLVLLLLGINLRTGLVHGFGFSEAANISALSFLIGSMLSDLFW